MSRLVFVWLVLLVACAGRETPTGGDSAISSDASADSTKGASAVSPIWLRQSRGLDLTGDGVVDSAVVEARGERSDSLQLRLAFIVGGRALFEQTWGSSYELANLDSIERHPPRSDAQVRRAVTKILGGIRMAPLDTAYVRDFPADTSALYLARRGSIQAITVAYGYETVMLVVWDPEGRRFVMAHACC